MSFQSRSRAFIGPFHSACFKVSLVRPLVVRLAERDAKTNRFPRFSLSPRPFDPDAGNVARKRRKAKRKSTGCALTQDVGEGKSKKMTWSRVCKLHGLKGREKGQEGVHRYQSVTRYISD